MGCYDETAVTATAVTARLGVGLRKLVAAVLSPFVAPLLMCFASGKTRSGLLTAQNSSDKLSSGLAFADADAAGLQFCSGTVPQGLQRCGADAAEGAAKGSVIILAAFGTSDPRGVEALFCIRRRVEEAFPDNVVVLAFTSPTVRRIWHERGYSVPDVAEALQKYSGRSVLVQSLHMTDGAEFHDVRKLAGDAGAPALGVGDGDDVAALQRAAEALSPLAARAEAAGAALVLMAHGNARLRQRVFQKFEAVLRERYFPEIHIGVVEGAPSGADIVGAVSEGKHSKVLLAPLMIVAGEHARRDMAEGWRGLFERAGFVVECPMEGLGSNPAWADIFVESIRRRHYGRF